jgi:hypothetical protein
MFLDKDLGYSSRTISRSQKHQQNTAVVRLWDIVGICQPDTLSLTKVADNIVIDRQRKNKEFVRSASTPPPLPRASLVGLVGGAITRSQSTPSLRRFESA